MHAGETRVSTFRAAVWAAAGRDGVGARARASPRSRDECFARARARVSLKFSLPERVHHQHTGEPRDVHTTPPLLAMPAMRSTALLSLVGLASATLELTPDNFDEVPSPAPTSNAGRTLGRASSLNHVRVLVRCLARLR